MKQLLSLLLFTLLFSFQGQTQDKEDILEVFQLLSELPEVQELYQNDIANGRSIIFTRPSRRSINRGDWNKEVFNAIFEIRNDDLYSFSNPVAFMTEEEAESQDIPPRRLANAQIIYTPTEVKIILGSYLWQSRQTYSGQFSFTRETEEDDWEVNSRYFETRRSN